MRVAIIDRQIELSWSDQAEPSLLHSAWLRRHCGCELCQAAQSSQPALTHQHNAQFAAPKAVSLTHAGDLSVVWQDNHRSLYTRSWLLTHDYHRLSPASHPINPWGRELPIPTHRHDSVVNEHSACLHFLNDLQRYGVALLKQAPLKRHHLKTLAAHISLPNQALADYPQSRTYDGQPNSTHSALHGVRPHSLPSPQGEASVQLVHCLENTLQGAKTLLVDGASLIERFSAEHPEHYHTLLNTPVPSTLNGATKPQTQQPDRPLIQLGQHGRFRRCHVPSGTLLPTQQSAQAMDQFYRASLCLSALADTPEQQLRVSLNAGDVLCVNTQRVLSGRSPSESTSGRLRQQSLLIQWADKVALRHLLRRQRVPMAWPHYAKGV